MDHLAREHYYTTHFKQFQTAEMDEATFQYYHRKFNSVLPVDKDAKILEIGTGTGKFLATLKRLGYKNLRGIDVSPQMVPIARKVSGEPVELIADIPQYLGSFQNEFDRIFLLDVIEHIEKASVIKYLNAIRLSLKQGGGLILSTENMASPIGRTQRYLDFTHEYNYTEITLRQVLEIAEFKNVRIWEMPDKMPLRPRYLVFWIVRRVWFALVKFLHKAERPNAVIPTIYGKEIIAGGDK